MSYLDYLASLVKNISLRKKLLLVILTATNAALLLTSIAVILYDHQSAKYTMQQEMKVLSSVISQRSAAALVFQDQQLAEESLHALSERSVVRAACVYDNDGKLFATYSINQKEYLCNNILPGMAIGFIEDGYIESNEVVLNGTRVGSLYIISSLDEINQRMMRFVAMVCIIFIVSGFISFILAMKLQNIITRPIDELAEAARRIRQDKTYSIRVKKVTNDEIGQLVIAFNEMLDDIEERDAMLVDAKKNLEEIVRARTAELHETQGELIRKDRMATLGQLAATVSHELRNPLGTIRTSIFTLSNRLNIKDESIRLIVDRIDRNILRCDSVITELLDYSRIRVMQHQKTNLSNWILTTLEDVDIPSDVTVSLDLDESIDVAIDRDLFRRVISNVISNAIQALAVSEDDLDNKKIIIECRVSSGRIEVIVNDTGPGIDEAILPRIFEPLFSTRNYGIGLGLSIVKQVMLQHGGSVEIVSEANIGTRVILWLPISLKVDSRDVSIAIKQGY